MRALDGFSDAYLGETAAGNTAPAAGAAAASLASPHSALRKSFQVLPPSVPAAFAALYFVLHSCTVSALAPDAEIARALAQTNIPAQRVLTIFFIANSITYAAAGTLASDFQHGTPRPSRNVSIAQTRQEQKENFLCAVKIVISSHFMDLGASCGKPIRLKCVDEMHGPSSRHNENEIKAEIEIPDTAHAAPAKDRQRHAPGAGSVSVTAASQSSIVARCLTSTNTTRRPLLAMRSISPRCVLKRRAKMRWPFAIKYAAAAYSA